MHLEIVDNITGKSYIGYDGVTLIDDSTLIHAILTDKGDYAVEKIKDNHQLCVAPKIKTEQEAITVIKSLLPLSLQNLTDSVSFLGYKRFNLEEDPRHPNYNINAFSNSMKKGGDFSTELHQVLSVRKPTTPVTEKINTYKKNRETQEYLATQV